MLVRSAYIDSSVVVAVAFEEKGANTVAKRLKSFSRVFSAPLLEAEFRGAMRREEREVDSGLLTAVEWVHPDRSLSEEIARVLEAGDVRGADCWHLATALYLKSDSGNLVFLTLDQRQRAVAKALGFAP